MEYLILSVLLTLMKARSRQHSLALMMVHNFYNRKLKVFTKFFLKNLPKGHLQPIFFLIINIQYMQVPDSCQNVCQILCPFICPVSFFLNNVLFSWPGWALTLYIECLWEWNVQWPSTLDNLFSSSQLKVKGIFDSYPCPCHISFPLCTNLFVCKMYPRNKRRIRDLL